MVSLRSLLNSTNTSETHPIMAVIDTALCVGAGGSSGVLADKPIVRNAEGNLIIPASQLKGRLRHECEKIARALHWQICESPSAGKMALRESAIDAYTMQFKQQDYQVPGYPDYHCLISQIFGDPILPSRLIVEDLICSEDPNNLPEVLRPGVSINRRRRTAEEQKLYLLETSPAHAQLHFAGQIQLLSDCPAYAKPLLLAGFQHIHALGGSKSAGLGWLHWQVLPQFEIQANAWEFLAKGGQP
ncbi:MAG: CRISPR-associated protein Csm3 [Acaryochloris sp. RU_4_1]|nr:CRISPR-associated protein Csm3 [Leptolyngbyaceae cyanobacterium SU_3_3]NJM65374.1 CRISPR-associated protein Csm3 [Acaryochloris sp. RU_4_1]NJR54088.1 CRISPR-associated protein Csm3 [Acaryochloris sp. CRU_2_0]